MRYPLLFANLFFVSSVQAEIIFETDFTKDVGYSITNQPLLNSIDVPDGWTAVRVSRDGVIEVVEDPTIANKPVLKITWDPTLAQPVVNLFKHLTGDINTGYDELFIRYHVRLPNNFKVGDGVKLNHWKWGRLWQNTSPTNPGPGQPGAWTENRVDAFYAVWNFNGIPGITDINSTWSANSGSTLDKGSAGGELYQLDYYLSGAVTHEQAGYFESVGNGSWDFITVNEDPANAGFLKNRNQTWHTIEYHFKLASTSTANDGVFEVWIDGIKQDGMGDGGDQGWRRIKEQYGAPAATGVPTAKNGGSGFNMFIMFDNLAGWNKDWSDAGVDGFIYVNDVVVSDEPIGHDYAVGQPLPPTNLKVKE